jgi:phage shock protein A
MWRVIVRFWKYLAMKLRLRHEELADPKVQLEQAIQEAREQHTRLTNQAANVLANQKQAQARLDRAVAAHDKAKGQVRQALLLADQEARAHRVDEAAQFSKGAELFAGRLLVLEREIEDSERALMQATNAAEAAKDAVAQNSETLRKRLAEREQLLTDLDQAKMQEQLATAMRQLTASFGEDVPTFDEVRRKIDLRLARSSAMVSMHEVEAPTDPIVIRVEQAQIAAEAQNRVAQLRTELGLAPAPLALEAPDWSRDARSR